MISTSAIKRLAGRMQACAIQQSSKQASNMQPQTAAAREVVKVFVDRTVPNAAIVANKLGTIRYRVVLEERLMNKMNRKDRAFFEATLQSNGEYALHKRMPNQKW